MIFHEGSCQKVPILVTWDSVPLSVFWLHPSMKKFNTFMTGFASVFLGVAGCFIALCEAVGMSFARSANTNPSSGLPKRTNVDYFDGFKKDREALASDWGKIGGDFRRAIDEHVQTHEGKANPVN